MGPAQAQPESAGVMERTDLSLLPYIIGAAAVPYSQRFLKQDWQKGVHL